MAAGAIAKKVLQNKLGSKYKVVGAVTQIGILGCNIDKWDEKIRLQSSASPLTANCKST